MGFTSVSIFFVNMEVIKENYITKKIWGSSLDGDIASLRVHVAMMRNKIESIDPDNKCIKTHIGVRYCMIKQE